MQHVTYIVYQPRKDHEDTKILAIQERMEKRYNQEFDADLIARRSGMSRRTFARRFKSATGDTPLAYLQRTRVEAAKQLLESGLQTCDEVAHRVGYEDSGFFQKVVHQAHGPGSQGLPAEVPAVRMRPSVTAAMPRRKRKPARELVSNSP